MYRFALWTIFSSLCLVTFGQNEVDALRYSYLNFGGTARFNSMAGSFGALGADISVVGSNPAGIGRYNRSEISFSPGFNIFGTDADYKDVSTSAQDFRLNLSQLGLVAVKQLKKDNFNDWRSFQFAFNYNKHSIYNQQTQIQGVHHNSMLAVFAEDARGYSPDNLETYLYNTSFIAYMTYGIDPDPNSSMNDYTHPLRYADSIQQIHTIDTKGGLNETSFSFSGNHGDNFFIGATIGIPSVNYEKTMTHTEIVYNNQFNDSLESFDYISHLNTSGTGINAKFGLIFMPVKDVRIGLAAHTPTYFGMNDTWSSEMETIFTPDSGYYYGTDVSRYKWSLLTPPKYIVSIAKIFAKRGAVNVDVEYIDYSNNKLNSRGNNKGYGFKQENATIESLYTGAVNASIGGEIRFNQYFVRGGYGYRGSPFDLEKENVVNTASRNTGSFGIGYRNKSFFLDGAFTHTWWSEDYYMYDPVLVNPATLNNYISNVTFTIGFRY